MVIRQTPPAKISLYTPAILNKNFHLDQLSISIAPALLIVGEGKTVHFNATANGINKNNFMYQWRKRDSDSFPNKVSGVNGLMLTIPDVTESDEGQYYCIVTNEWSRSVESNNGSLAVSGNYISLYITMCYACLSHCSLALSSYTNKL